MKSIVRFILAFIAGTICYAVGFLVGGVIMSLMNAFSIVPSTVVLQGTELTASALAANGLAIAVFNKIDNIKLHSAIFSVWLIIIAAVYLALCVVSGDLHLIWYSVVSLLLAGYCVIDYAKGINGGDDA